MLTGSVTGGYIAQVTSLGVPFLLRGAVLVVMFGLAFAVMRDIGFTPRRGGRLTTEMRAIASASIEHGWRVPAVKWIMLSSVFTGGVGFYVFYALQPYLLELAGTAGGVRHRRAGCRHRGRCRHRRRDRRPLDPQALPPQDLGAAGRRGGRDRDARTDRRLRALLGGAGADRGVGPPVLGGHCPSGAHT